MASLGHTGLSLNVSHSCQPINQIENFENMKILEKKKMSKKHILNTSIWQCL